jgi:hypothetical protein
MTREPRSKAIGEEVGANRDEHQKKPLDEKKNVMRIIGQATIDNAMCEIDDGKILRMTVASI